MEEKERYSFDEVLEIIYDNQEKYYPTNGEICGTLNQQDKEIQQLKEENGYIIFSDGYDEDGNEIHRQEFVKYKDKFKELVDENLQLKQLQKQLAIEELNNLKKYCHEWYSWSDVAKRLDEVVDDRIKKLSGGLNE